MKLEKVDDRTAYENLLVKYAELENKIADIKANCDLAIEGRDVKIKELELELTVEKDQHQEEINLHLHAEDYIESLEKENEELKADNDARKFAMAMSEKVEKQLREENKELRNNGFTVSAMTEQQLKVALEKGEQLEKENAKLKKHNENLIALINAERERQEKCDDVHLRKIKELEKENAQAKELIREWLQLHNSNTKKTIIKKSEQFLKESE